MNTTGRLPPPPFILAFYLLFSSAGVSLFSSVQFFLCKKTCFVAKLPTFLFILSAMCSTNRVLHETECFFLVFFSGTLSSSKGMLEAGALIARK